MDKAIVLIIESEILARHPLAEYLRHCGFTVVEAASRDEARDFLERGLIEIDIVLADVSHSGGADFDLAQWIRTTRPSVRVLLAGGVSAAAKDAGDLCEEHPAAKKPYDHKLVEREIRRLLAERDRNRQGGEMENVKRSALG